MLPAVHVPIFPLYKNPLIPSIITGKTKYENQQWGNLNVFSKLCVGDKVVFEWKEAGCSLTVCIKVLSNIISSQTGQGHFLGRTIVHILSEWTAYLPSDNKKDLGCWFKPHKPLTFHLKAEGWLVFVTVNTADRAISVLRPRTVLGRAFRSFFFFFLFWFVVSVHFIRSASLSGLNGLPSLNKATDAWRSRPA